MADYWRDFETAVDFAHAPWWQQATTKPLKTLTYYVVPRLCRLCGMSLKIRAQTFCQEDMRVLFPEDMSRQIFYYGGVESEVIQFFLAYLKEGMTLIDIGSHIGYFTLLASKIVGESGPVHAFEPTENTFEVLKKNTSDKTNIKINLQALWSTTTVMAFNDYGSRYSGLNGFMPPRIFKDSNIEVERVLSVECTTLDAYCFENGVKPDFIKIDAESSEFYILHGGEQIITRQQPVICLEVGDANVPGAKKSRECVSFLLDRGYTAFEENAGALVPHHPGHTYGYKNLLFVPARLL